jgi:hypothetical protein
MNAGMSPLRRMAVSKIVSENTSNDAPTPKMAEKNVTSWV